MRNLFQFLFLISLQCLSGCGQDESKPPKTPVVPISLPVGYEIFVSDAKAPSKILQYDHEGKGGKIFINQNLNWTQDILFLEDQNIFLVSSLSSGNIGRHNATTGEFIDYFATNIDGPTRMKIGKDNLLYILEWGVKGRVLRYSLNGEFVDEFTTKALVQSIGLDWDKSGNLYVSTYTKVDGGYVRKFSPSGEDLGIFISGSLAGPTNIWFDNDDNLYVVDYNAGAVKLFNPSGTFTKNVIQGLNIPEGVAIVEDGSLLIGNGGTGSVKMYNKDFKYLGDIVVGNAAGLSTPNAVYLLKK